MVIFRLDGGWGNRYFQYLAINNKYSGKERIVFLVNPGINYTKELALLGITNVSVVQSNKLLRKLHYILERKMNRKILNVTFLSGWFQSLDYIEIRKSDRQGFVAMNEKRVVVHVRRGDYYSPRFRSVYGDICTRRYYEEALRELSSRHDIVDIPIYWCSDDPDWVLENFPGANIFTSGCPYKDWEFIANSCYIIISNSTYSLTAAYSSEKSFVLYPSVWNRKIESPGLFKESWIKIEAGC